MWNDHGKVLFPPISRATRIIEKFGKFQCLDPAIRRHTHPRGATIDRGQAIVTAFA
jgi:hypothetical protein